VAVDSNNNIIVSGTFRGTINFGGGNLAAVGTEDTFLAKLSPSGNYIWAQRFGSSSLNSGCAVAVDGSDNIFLTGYFNVAIDFGGVHLTGGGGPSFCVAKF